MATAVIQDYEVSSTNRVSSNTSSSVSDYFNNTENDAESDLEIRLPTKKPRGSAINYLFKKKFDNMQQAKEALSKFEDCKCTERNHYDGEEDRKTDFNCKQVLGAEFPRLVMLSQSNSTKCEIMFTSEMIGQDHSGKLERPNDYGLSIEMKKSIDEIL